MCRQVRVENVGKSGEQFWIFDKYFKVGEIKFKNSSKILKYVSDVETLGSDTEVPKTSISIFLWKSGKIFSRYFIESFTVKASIISGQKVPNFAEINSEVDIQDLL